VKRLLRKPHVFTRYLTSSVQRSLGKIATGRKGEERSRKRTGETKTALESKEPLPGSDRVNPNLEPTEKDQLERQSGGGGGCSGSRKHLRPPEK